MNTRLLTTLATTAAHAATMLSDREAAHRMVMALWGHRQTATARADLAVLWAVRSIDPVRGNATVLVQSRMATERRLTWVESQSTTPLPDPQIGETIKGTMSIVAIRTPLSPLPEPVLTALQHRKEAAGNPGVPRRPGEGLAWRAKEVPVPDNEIPAWMTQRLTRDYGIDATIDLVRGWEMHLPGKRARYHCATIAINGTVTNTDHAARFLHGVGKAKSYGCGLLVPDG